MPYEVADEGLRGLAPSPPCMKTRMRPRVLSAPLVALALLAQTAGYAQTRETLFIGQFLTLDPAHPSAEALVAANGRIVMVGSRADAERLVPSAAPRVRIRGVAVPGLADAHIHVTSVGERLARLNLQGLSKAQVLQRVETSARHAAPGEWIRGGGWDEGFWQPSTFPTAGELDAVSAGHPVVLDRIDGHSTWINSKVLELARIGRDTPDPSGGRIERDAAHDPTGMLVDNAQNLLEPVLPKATREDQERWIKIALAQFARWGLTSVHDAGVDLDTIQIYKSLLARGELTVRVYAMALGEQAREHYLPSGPEPDLGNGMLAVRSFKLFLDGALGSRGAELSEPYSDAPNDRGLELTTDADLDRIVRAAMQKGFQVNTHAIGDAAVRRALDAFQRAGVTPEQRFRIEHASLMTDEDLPRFAKLGVIASIQPVFVGEYSRWAEDRVGKARVKWVLRTRDLLEAGAPLASGSDYPDSDSGAPIAALHCLVTRQSALGLPPAGWYAGQRIDVDRAMHMVTVGPAFAAFQEHELGALTAGRYADFTVLSANPRAVRPEDLRTLAVRMTVVAGRIVFDGERPGATP